MLRKAIEIDSDSTDPWYNKACIESIKNNCEKAVEFLKKVIELDKDLKIEAKSDPDFDNIKNQKEFKDLLR